LEGEAGVGKTEVAKVLTDVLDTELIRLQCYEGLDVHHAVYEWNYSRQMMHIRVLEARGERVEEKDLFSAEFLLRRPLLQAIENSNQKAPVLLVDEIDRSDEEFEAFLMKSLRLSFWRSSRISKSPYQKSAPLRRNGLRWWW